MDHYLTKPLRKDALCRILEQAAGLPAARDP